jgi:mersacidin/lichenicidin family type 2 lantibiotic
MSEFDIVKAWKDVKYRRTLTAKQLAQLPANPAGIIEEGELPRRTSPTSWTWLISDPCNNC